MDRQELFRYLKKYAFISKNLLGIGTIREILAFDKKFKNRKNCFVIINTNEYQYGKNIIGHWLLLGKFNNRLIFFDSLGKQPSTYSSILNKFINNLSIFVDKSLFYNPYHIQGNTSCTCSLYCTFFVYYLSLGFGFDKILNHFKKHNSNLNDRLIIKWFRKKFGNISNPKYKFCIF